jgi:hypothetical protein
MGALHSKRKIIENPLFYESNYHKKIIIKDKKKIKDE